MGDNIFPLQLPLLDDMVDILMSRDSDSPIINREEDAVLEWFASDKTFHIMRDHPAHCVFGYIMGCRHLNTVMITYSTYLKFGHARARAREPYGERRFFSAFPKIQICRTRRILVWPQPLLVELSNFFLNFSNQGKGRF
jgi:hypothetical protein